MKTNRGLSPRTRQRALTIAIGVALAAIAAATRADVSIVSDVNVTGAPNRGPGPGMGFGGAAQKFPKTVSIYYKGAKARAEEKGGPVTIYDAAAGKIYTLDTTKKTYYVQSLSEIGTGGRAPFAQAGATPPPSSKITLKQTDDTQTIASAKAAKFSVDGSLSFGFGFGGRFGGGGGFRGGPPMGGDGNGGGPPGGGDFNGGPPGGGPPDGAPGGGQDDAQGGGNSARRRGRGRANGARMAPPATKVTGYVWLSDKVKLPSGKGATALPSAQWASVTAFGLVKPLADALDAQGDLPLRSEITITRSMPPRPSMGDDATGDGTPPAPIEIKTVVTTVVKSLSTKALSDTLFTVPSGYKKVDPPARPFGRFGGRRGGANSQGNFGGGPGGGGGFGGGGQQGGDGAPPGDDNGGPPPMDGGDGGPPPMDGGGDGGPPMDGGPGGPPPPDGGDG
ncbi:hypothetical protein CCAX7_18140 [Capsulimonas corticalis]|uniref:Uncharacterized protein n=1 Tax=Capsulimonas corticalis TaxID=2219043 RepID=A0A402D5C9_9BACT|nr:hypothetical protein [Capsulimonas corticalis]BDI29763.1 hypothetical protein CCAX7_18140 [Capsulimonas corticalis]